MSSIDGRLLAERWTEPAHGKNKDQLYEPYFQARKKLNGQASLIGRNTVQKDFSVDLFPYRNYLPAPEFIPFKSTLEADHYFIVFDRKGKLAYETNMLEGSGIIAVLSESVSEEYLVFLREKNISYLFAGPEGNDLPAALNVLGTIFAFQTLLLEGGGTLNGSFLKEGLINEWSLLVYPGLDGLSEIPSIVDYKGKENEFPAAGQTLELRSVETLPDGIVWLRYRG